MRAVEVKNISKKYGQKTIVEGVSFDLSGGEVLGMIGPNGAGKTTTIRMIMDVIKPDSGEVLLFGTRFNNDLKHKIGYLPEERGLYRKLKIMDSVAYLASLKGASREAAVSRAEMLLKRFDLFDHRHKKIDELSKGMGQLVQFVVTIAHDPGLVILDEPFAGLDPVNSRLLKDTIKDLRAEGKAIILSTHRMYEVEETCDRLFMINKGQRLLYGGLDEIRRQFRSHAVIVESQSPLPDLKGVLDRKIKGRGVELKLDGETSPQAVLEELVAAGIPIERFEVALPSLDEIFVQVVKKP